MADINLPIAEIAESGALCTPITLPVATIYEWGGMTRAPYLYVCDSGNNRISVTDYNGVFQFSFGTAGSGDGEFNAPWDVYTDGNLVYVSDSGNNRIQIFTLDGEYVDQFGSFGSGDGQFNNPMGVRVDDYYIWVVDNRNNRFQVFDKTTYAFLEAIGEYGSGVDQFDGPTAARIDDVFFYIYDAGNHRWLAYPKIVPTGYIDAEMPGMESEIELVDVLTLVLDAEMPGMQSDITVLGTSLPAIDAEMPGLESDIVAEITSLIAIDAEMPGMESEIVLLGSLTLELDAEMPGMLAEIMAEITGDREVIATVVINSLNKAVSEYSGFNFNSYSKFQGKYIGAFDGATEAESGIFELAGNTDDGDEIAAEFHAGDIDLHAATDQERRKIRRVYDVHVLRKATGDIALVLRKGQNDNKVREFTIKGSSDNLPHMKRVPHLKGIKEQIIRLGIKNLKGADFEIQQVVADAAPIGKDEGLY